MPQRGFKVTRVPYRPFLLTFPVPTSGGTNPPPCPARISLASCYALLSQSFRTCPGTAPDTALSERLLTLAHATDLSMSRTRASLDLIANSTALGHHRPAFSCPVPIQGRQHPHLTESGCIKRWRNGYKCGVGVCSPVLRPGSATS